MSAAGFHPSPLAQRCGKPLGDRVRVAGSNVGELPERDDDAVAVVAVVRLDVHDVRLGCGSSDPDVCTGRRRAVQSLTCHDLLERNRYPEQTHVLKVQQQREVLALGTPLTLEDGAHTLKQSWQA